MAAFTILEPMSSGDIIDRAVRLYRRNFAPLVVIVAVPTLIGYLVSMMFWFGLSELQTSGDSGSTAGAIIMLALGMLGYPVWFFTFLVVVSGLSRVIADHVMMGEVITVRKCFAAVRRRLGDIFLMGLLTVAIAVAAYIALVMILFGVIIVVGIFVGVTASLGLPPWAATVTTTIAVLAVLALGIMIVLAVVARVVFLPQVIMIEGQSAGSALSRTFYLGKRNWHRVGAIVLFTYFVSLSLLAALTLPVLSALYLFGALTSEVLVSPLWNAVYTAFNQVTNLLALPIWVVSLTLLYFDSRVRKEAYDIELLAREVAPGFYWQPTVQQSAFGYQMPVTNAAGRAYVQTSPLGLAGYVPPRPPPPEIAATQPQASATQPVTAMNGAESFNREENIN